MGLAFGQRGIGIGPGVTSRCPRTSRLTIHAAVVGLRAAEIPFAAAA
ncbi:hypothetical protein I545_6122 [Mycobacterium kansasii 662]|uniref:Uncharacterized protein n=2 Tax=Mycobacterium kansasii TaxID=1768 RepID=A0A1V3XCG2_MYCKA|nr:hypothetical protein I547_5755 [Mycobacterium kansasii 824]EUA09202.1 hypothetical protein I545_6122 [Mycobacterium kansasii 662]KEP41573.1 hypothetical protein MKSMC1_33460 [Mycobacterium kansasii]OOK74030.1 hypothetical protein BZL30_4715 [Mycobacterium kansasii]OOK76857.1 hypothetical protein BZL29_4015 [Mycobacterium kansasii]